MIASFGPWEEMAMSGTIVSAVTNCTCTAVYYTIACSSYYDVMVEIPERDPKARIPFYRALFDQSFPAPTPPRKIMPRGQYWKPAMGRVRIDRSTPRMP